MCRSFFFLFSCVLENFLIYQTYVLVILVTTTMKWFFWHHAYVDFHCLTWNEKRKILCEIVIQKLKQQQQNKNSSSESKPTTRYSFGNWRSTFFQCHIWIHYTSTTVNLNLPKTNSSSISKLVNDWLISHTFVTKSQGDFSPHHTKVWKKVKSHKRISFLFLRKKIHDGVPGAQGWERRGHGFN